ncbi:MAG: hypothetical protein Q4C65_07675 [Eubacteriales bacterium]|nr:hypothetical protein [Eubacteriales bacterium]
MRLFFHYLKMDVVRTIETKRLYLCTLGVFGIGFVVMLELSEMYLDVLYVFHQIKYSMSSILVFFFTAVPCAAMLEEDMENKFYRQSVIRGKLKAYAWAKTTVIFLTPAVILCAGNLLFVIVVSRWLPWSSHAGISNIAGDGNWASQYLIGR